MNFRSTIRLTISIFLLLLMACDSSSTRDERPNIILIIADDLGIGSLSCYNPKGKIETPNLDNLAGAGWQYDQFYVTSPVCSPSRASIMTGLTPVKAGIEKVLKPGKTDKQSGLAETTIAHVLENAGYRTGLIGKWHLGYSEEEHPRNQGFKTFKGFINGHIDYISHCDPNNAFKLERNGREWKAPQGEHLTEILTNEAIGFIHEDSKTPYFLMLSYANPHVPILLPGEDAQFPGKADPDVNTPDRYKQLVELLDVQVGRLVEHIEEESNTVIIFLSDHGASDNLEANGPYHGGKGNLLEGGINVPAILSWPGKLTPRRISSFSSSLDIFPTLLDLSGTTADSEKPRNGKSLLDEIDHPQSREFLWSYSDVEVFRRDDWKAIFLKKGEKNQRVLNKYEKALPDAPPLDWSDADGSPYAVWLFDLSQDLKEENNLAVESPERVQEMWVEALNFAKTQNK